jgi:hypothetical protein
MPSMSYQGQWEADNNNHSNHQPMSTMSASLRNDGIEQFLLRPRAEPLMPLILSGLEQAQLNSAQTRPPFTAVSRDALQVALRGITVAAGGDGDKTAH